MGKIHINRVVTEININLHLVGATKEVHGTMRTFNEGEDGGVCQDLLKKGRFELRCEE